MLLLLPTFFVGPLAESRTRRGLGILAGAATLQHARGCFAGLLTGVLVFRHFTSPQATLTLHQLELEGSYGVPSLTQNVADLLDLLLHIDAPTVALAPARRLPIVRSASVGLLYMMFSPAAPQGCWRGYV